MESLSMVKGKVVLVSFPFDDFSEEKIRPASKEWCSEQHGTNSFVGSKYTMPLSKMY